MPSSDTAFDSLRTLFSTTHGTSLSFAEVIAAWGRTAYTEQENRRWLANKLIAWRKYGFIETIYAPNSNGRGHVIDRVHLTPVAEQAIAEGMVPPTPTTVPEAQGTSAIGLPDVLRLFARLKGQYPDGAVSMDIELRVTGRDASGEILVTPETARIEILPQHEAMESVPSHTL